MSTYHAGEIEVQKRAGVRLMAERVGGIIDDTLPSGARVWLRAQRLIALAVLAPDGLLWVQLLSGPLGFLSSPDERTLLVQAQLAPDDPLQGALERGAGVGTIVFEPAKRRRLRFNGWAQSEANEISIQAREVYSNCPKYIQARLPEEIEPSPPSNPPVAAALIAQGSELSPWQRTWISSADTFFIGSMHAQSGVDCSHRGGNPGFVQVEGNTLSWPDYPGNAMFNTLGNLMVDGRAGLVFPDWQNGAALQLTGQAQVDGDTRGVRFEVSAWRHVTGVLPTMWRFMSYSPFNPA